MGLSSLIETARNLGKYELIEKIGEGYLGPVYRGFDQDLATPVVIRVLCDGIKWDSKLEELFRRETRTIAGLQHPNIAAVLDIGMEGSTRYIAMESLGSGTLESLIAQNSTISVETKLSIMIHISEGLSYAHKHGILHRDLVPGKIHLAPDGSAKIRDFALANILMKYLPHPIVRWGAPIYLCPEQIQHKDCDGRSDIFSAGTIFYELLTHVHPFHDRDSNKALDNILSDAPIPTFEKFPDAPAGIWTILRSCLAKSPEERYQSADEIAEACRKLLVSLAEDKQLILSELYASLSPLKKAAAQANAAASTIALLHDIQILLREEKEADYACLDRLMSSLTEEYPAIQAAACAPPELSSLCPQSPTEAPEAEKQFGVISSKIAPEPQVVPSEPIPEPESVSPQMPAIEPEVLQPESGLEENTMPPQEPVAKFVKSTDIQTPLLKAAKEPLLLPVASASNAQIPARVSAETIEPAAGPVTIEKCAQIQPATAHYAAMPAPTAGVRMEAEYMSLPPSASRYRKLRRPSYRSAVVLLSILVMAAAGYIVMRSEAPAFVREGGNSVLLYWNKISHTVTPPNQNSVSGNEAVGASVRDSKENAGRNAVEVERFSLAHDHGMFRGACRGVLSLSSLEVTFSPTSGSHGFQIPFKLLKLKADGKSLDLYYLSDNSHFQTFSAADEQTADKLTQKWNELKSMPH
jgi:serine/threonine protein kinase